MASPLSPKMVSNRSSQIMPKLNAGEVHSDITSNQTTNQNSQKPFTSTDQKVDLKEGSEDLVNSNPTQQNTQNDLNSNSESVANGVNKKDTISVETNSNIKSFSNNDNNKFDSNDSANVKNDNPIEQHPGKETPHSLTEEVSERH